LRYHAGALAGDPGCTAPDDAPSYLVTPRRSPPVTCPWDARPPPVIAVHITSTTSIHVSWNVTSSGDVVLSVAEATNTTDQLHVEQLAANVSDRSVGNLTAGHAYLVCVTTTSGSHRACVVVALPVEPLTTTSPASLELRISATATATELQVFFYIKTICCCHIKTHKSTTAIGLLQNDVLYDCLNECNLSFL